MTLAREFESRNKRIAAHGLRIAGSTNCRFGRYGLVVALTLLAWVFLLPSVQAQVTFDGCHDINGVQVLSVIDINQTDVAHASLVNGRPEILYNPNVLIRLQPQTRQFFYAHECGHHALGQVLTGLEANAEQQADCWGIQELVTLGRVTQADVQVIQSDISRFGKEDWTHLPGKQRAINLQGCLNRSDNGKLSTSSKNGGRSQADTQRKSDEHEIFGDPEVSDDLEVAIREMAVAAVDRFASVKGKALGSNAYLSTVKLWGRTCTFVLDSAATCDCNYVHVPTDQSAVDDEYDAIVLAVTNAVPQWSQREEAQDISEHPSRARRTHTWVKRNGRVAYIRLELHGPLTHAGDTFFLDFHGPDTK